MEKKMESNIGEFKTLGELIGEKKDSLELKEESMKCVLKKIQLLKDIGDL